MVEIHRKRIQMEDLLKIVVERDASDLHLRVGRPPVIRIDGRLEDLGNEPLTPEDTEYLMNSISPDMHREAISEIGSADYGYAFQNLARFRVSIFRTMGKYGMVMRLIPSRILSFEVLGLPLEATRTAALPPRAGAGGRSHRRANHHAPRWTHQPQPRTHITIGTRSSGHPHRKSIVTTAAGRHLLRRPPAAFRAGRGNARYGDMQAAITAAVTGHLVFATLHTNASATINRIVDAFPAITNRSHTGLGHPDRLHPGAPGRASSSVAAYEIMVMTPAIAA